MRNSLHFVDQRRNSIITLLEQYGQVKVSILAEELDVSPLTIRRDLDFLEQQHILTRQYGVATLMNPGSNAFSSSQVHCKTSIARAAAQMVKDQETIFINTSSTALLMMQYITAKNVTIITNSGKALQMPFNSSMTVVLTGGEIRIPKESMFGEFALQNINRVTAKKCFMGCAGLSAESGLTTALFQESPVNSLMLKRSEKHYILADYTKIGTSAGFQYGAASDIDLLITDESASKAALGKLKRIGVEIMVVNSSEGKDGRDSSIWKASHKK